MLYSFWPSIISVIKTTDFSSKQLLPNKKFFAYNTNLAVVLPFNVNPLNYMQEMSLNSEKLATCSCCMVLRIAD
jgi:hypothetical protein